jgi:zinc D-Ala-D-Ala carboxypeptidase
MQISEHLLLAELTRSESAKRRGLSNMPTPEHIENLKGLAANIFEPIRAHFNVPIHISSGYRSQELNKAIKGSKSSQHCKGEAIDVDMDGTAVSNAQVFDFISDNLKFDQLIWEFGTNDNPSWVHVSFAAGGNQRGQKLKAVQRGNKTAYLPM